MHLKMNMLEFTYAMYRDNKRIHSTPLAHDASQAAAHRGQNAPFNAPRSLSTGHLLANEQNNQKSRIQWGFDVCCWFNVWRTACNGLRPQNTSPWRFANYL